jgi:hypothetical protein
MLLPLRALVQEAYASRMLRGTGGSSTSTSAPGVAIAAIACSVGLDLKGVAAPTRSSAEMLASCDMAWPPPTAGGSCRCGAPAMTRLGLRAGGPPPGCCSIALASAATRSHLGTVEGAQQSRQSTKQHMKQQPAAARRRGRRSRARAQQAAGRRGAVLQSPVSTAVQNCTRSS